MEAMGLSQSKEAEAVLHTIPTDGPCSADLFSLYEDTGGMTGLFANVPDKPRLFVHLALAALRTNQTVNAMRMLDKIPKEAYDAPTPPAHHTELLRAVNARIILQMEDGDFGGALYELQRRSEIISEWIGSKSLELAHNLHRLACLHSALGHHEECMQALKQSLSVGGAHDEYDSLDSIKLLAVSYDAINDKGKMLQFIYILFPVIDTRVHL